MSFFQVTPDRDRPAGWKILNIFGIPVYVEPAFLAFIALIFFINSEGDRVNIPETGILCFVIFISILVHELGHALVSKMLGCDSIRIALVMFGGYATHSPTTRGKSLAISLAGPAFGFGLGIAALAFSAWGGPLLNLGPDNAMNYVIVALIFINFFWSIFNLIPIHPLDGGQALFHTLSHFVDTNAAMLWVARVSVVLCAGLIGLALLFQQIFIAFFGVMFLVNNWRIARLFN